MSRRRIYLASPYSHEDNKVREQRYIDICKIAGDIIAKDPKNNIVFCPIAHSHSIQENSNIKKLGTEFNFWKYQDIPMLSTCDELIVVMMDGWRLSTGVQEEIRIAKELLMPITYLAVETGSIQYETF